MWSQKITALLALVLLGVFYTAGNAAAHSTKGRLKINLEKAAPTVDDFAYFMESYVHREFYRGKYPKWEKRFYVKEFTGVELHDNEATVNFLTLDNKEKTDFAASMTFHRAKRGDWHYIPDNGGEPVQVYTYVRKWGYYYKRYFLPMCIAGVSGSVVALGFLVFTRKRKSVAEAAC